MVLTDAERVQAHLIGEHRFLDDIAQHARLRQQGAVIRNRDVAERIEPEREGRRHVIFESIKASSARR